jgi:hypothetical protein
LYCLYNNQQEQRSQEKIMKRTTLAIALYSIFSATPGMADALEDRLQHLEHMLQQLQAQVDKQGSVINRQDQTIQRQGKTIEQQADVIEDQRKHLDAPRGDGGGDWFQSVEMSGVVEVEASHTDSDGPDTPSENDLTLATVELGISAQINDWTSAEIILLHEEDDTELEVDVGTITIADPDAPWFVTTGQFYLPFGAFESNMISDPLTLEVAETRESALQIGFDNGRFNGSVYAFNGDNKKQDGDTYQNRIDNWGANLGFVHEGDSVNFGAGAGYINDIGDSDAIQDALSATVGNEVDDHVGGWTVNAIAEAGPFTLIGEYVRATDDFEFTELPFDGGGAQPKAWNAEVGYGFSIMGKDSTLAAAYQRTKEAVALELPRRRLLVGWSIDIMENTALSFEWAHDKDYSISDGGTGEDTDTITTQLAVEFP